MLAGAETFEVGGFECPHCVGTGCYTTGARHGSDKGEQYPCPPCNGTGALTASVAISWMPAAAGLLPAVARHMDAVIVVFCARCGITRTELSERTRRADIVALRQMCCYVLRKNNFSNAKIGAALGFDHATVIHSARVVAEKLEVGDRVLTEIFEKVKDLIGNKATS